MNNAKNEMALRWLLAGFAIFVSHVAFAQPASACKVRAVNVLHQDSTIGDLVFATVKDKTVFYDFIECGRDTFYQSLPTAVHESTHMIRSEREAYLLASGEFQPVASDAKYFAPKKMAKKLARDLRINVKDDLYYSTYVAPQGDGASSRDLFSYLLDELNAYTVDLKVGTDLATKGRAPVNPQNHGQPALMAYVAYYVQYAKASEPTTWQRLQNDAAMKLTIQKIWDQAERVLAAACASSQVGDDPGETENYLLYLCTNPNVSAISQILGRASNCPSGCAKLFRSGT